MNRKTRSIHNVIWAISYKLVSILAPFITRTVLIYSLGVEYLGISSLFSSILQLLNLVELGFGSAVTFSMYKPIAENNTQMVAGLLNYFKKVYRIIGVVLLIIGLCLVPFLDYLIEGSVPDDIDIRVVYLLYLANTVLSYWLFAYKNSLLNAYQRNDVLSKVLIVIAPCKCVLQCVFLIFIRSFYLFVAVIPLMTFIYNCCSAWLARKLFPEYTSKELRQAFPGVMTRKDIRKRVFGLMINRVCATTRDGCDSVVISAFLGLAMVGSYSNYFLILSSVLGILETVGPAITASIGNSIVLESKEKNFSDFRRFIFIYMLPSGVCVACLLCLYQSFMYIWVGEGLMLSNVIVILLCIYFYVRTMGDIRAIYVDATGIWWEQRWRCVWETVANLVLSLVLVQFIGLAGVCLATILSLFFINFCYGSHLLFKYYFDLKRAGTYYRDHALYFLVVLAVCVVTYVVLMWFPDGGILLFIGKTLLALIISSITELLLVGKTRRFKDAMAFLVRVLHARKE